MTDIFQLLREGTVETCELIPWGSNYTFCARLSQDGRSTLAVYKPQRGERPLWDFPPGTLYLREYAAYLTSEALGWRFVPPTVVRDGPHGIGSVQLFVESEPMQSMAQIEACSDPDLARIAAFDLITNNADRKGAHILVDAAGRLWAIDHGLCFNVDHKLRTILQHFCGGPLPPEVLGELRAFQGSLERREDARRRLAAALGAEEVAAFDARVDWLAEHGVYPWLNGYRSVPWPPF